MTAITDAMLKEWEGLCEKATPGDWITVPQHIAGPLIAHSFETGQKMRPTGLRLICHMMERGKSLSEDQANAAFIAAARTALPLLIAEVRKLRGDHG